MFSELILTKSFPAAIRRVREHRALGHRTVLITGALDFVDRAAAPAVRRHRARRRSPRDADGTYRGELTDVPPTGEARARRCSTTPTPNGFDLARVGRLRRLDLATCRCSRPSASRSR